MGCRTIYLPLLGTLLMSCTPGQFVTMTVYETPSAFVRLETDRTVEPDTGHTHPTTLTAQDMAALLCGVVIEEPLTRLPLYDDLSQPRRHAAFTEQEVTFFAPLLALALSKATPEEIVTFYETRSLSGTSREVTSGGLFVEDTSLHLILGNYRSPTHYTADIGVADTTDDRLTPLKPLAPQRGTLSFEPREAVHESTHRRMAAWLQTDRRELVIDYRRAIPAAGSPARPSPVPAP